MKEWKEITHYAGFDWARDHHVVVIVNQQGQIVADFEFEHSVEGWKSFGEKTAGFANLAVAIETSQGAAVDQMLQRDYTLYPVNPAAAASYRQRKAPSGTKTDHIDGWSLADALRVDGQGWRALQPADELSTQLRLLCRDEVALIAQRTLLVNQLQQALVEYYPAALEAFEDWVSPATWDFVLEFPTPETISLAACPEPRRCWPRGSWPQSVPTLVVTALSKCCRASPELPRSALNRARSTRPESAGTAINSCAIRCTYGLTASTASVLGARPITERSVRRV